MEDCVPWVLWVFASSSAVSIHIPHLLPFAVVDLYRAAAVGVAAVAVGIAAGVVAAGVVVEGFARSHGNHSVACTYLVVFGTFGLVQAFVEA